VTGSPSPVAYSPKLDNLRGVLWMLAAVLALTAMFTILKQMTTELPIFVVAITRTFVALICMAPWLMRVGVQGLATSRMKLHFLRSLFGIAAFSSVMYALSKLLLADTMVLSFTSPFWSIIISALVLGEAIRRYRTVATIVGFVGMVLIVKPGGGVDPAMLVALLSAVLTSGAMISMKSLSTTEPPARIVFYFFLYGTLALAPFAAITWQTPSLVQLGWLTLAGILGSIGQTFLARAYAAADVTVVAPFDFVRLPLAALFGFIFLAEIPDIWSGVGTLIIIGASLYIARRESRDRARQPG
jgi:drug/metabolite transporter (DMT)-like permease